MPACPWQAMLSPHCQIVLGMRIRIEHAGRRTAHYRPKIKCAWFLRDRMTARRVNIKRKAAALEAAEAQRRFQAETLGEAAQPAEGPNQDRFLQQLTGRVRSAPTWTALHRQPPAWLQLPLRHFRKTWLAQPAPWQGNVQVNACTERRPVQIEGGHVWPQDTETDKAQWACRATPKRRGRAAAPPSSKAKARDRDRARGRMVLLRHRALALGTSLGRRAVAAARTFRQTRGRQSGSIRLGPCWVIAAVSQAHLCWDAALIFSSHSGPYRCLASLKGISIYLT